MKQAVTIFLALLLCFLVSMSASAAEITGLDDDFGRRGYYVDDKEYRHGEVSDLAYLESVRPGTQYFIPLSRRDFEWEDDISAPVTFRSMQELGVRLNLDYQRGNNLFEAIRITERGDTAGILIAFSKSFVSTEPEEFEVDVRLLVNDEAYDGCGFTVKGTIANRGMPVSTYDKSCTLGYGRYAVGYDNVSGVRFHLGEGVSVVSDIQFTDRYFGAVTAQRDVRDDEIMGKYPQIEKVLRLDTVGLRGSVSIESDRALYVYDETLAYLGTTSQTLPFRGKYYLTASAL